MRTLRFPLERITFSNTWVPILRERGLGQGFEVRDGEGLTELLVPDALSRVETLAIDAVQARTMRALSAVRSLPALRRLTLIGHGHIRRGSFAQDVALEELLTHLDAPLLESIDLQKMCISGETVAALAANPSVSSLKVLAMTECSIGPDISPLATRFDALHSISLAGSHGAVDELVTALAPSCPALSWFELRSSDVGDAGVTAICDQPAMNKLEVLLLDHSRVCDDGAVAIARSPHLSALTDLLLARVTHRGFAALLETKHPPLVKAANRCSWMVLQMGVAPSPPLLPERLAHVRQVLVGKQDIATGVTALHAEGLWPADPRGGPRSFRSRTVDYESYYGSHDGAPWNVSPLYEGPLPPNWLSMVYVAALHERVALAEELALTFGELLGREESHIVATRVTWCLYEFGWWRYEPPPTPAWMRAMRRLASSTPYDTSVFWPHAYADILAGGGDEGPNLFTVARDIVDLGFWLRSIEGDEVCVAMLASDR